MKIIQNGNPKLVFSATKRFRCGSCGCVFEAEKDEYANQTNFDAPKMLYVYKCLCPECHCVANEVFLRGNGAL